MRGLVGTGDLDPRDPAFPEHARQALGPTGNDWCVSNLVTGLDGGVSDPGGVSAGLSSGADRALLAAIRSWSDAVITGAATVRSEQLRQPRTALLVIPTRSGALGPTAADLDPRRTLLAVPRSRVDAVRAHAPVPGAEILELDDDLPLGRSLPAALRARGLRRLVCEGGPEVFGAFLRAGALDHLYLSVAPRIFSPSLPLVPGAGTPFTQAFETDRMLLDDDGMLYRRLTPRAERSAATA